MSDLISEVKAALQAATPGPWTTNQDDITAGDTTIAWEVANEHDMHLIANSPTWLQQLIDRVEVETKENEVLHNLLMEAVKALEWYGDADNHKWSHTYDETGETEEIPSKVASDRGRMAVTTLKRIKGENG